MSLRNSGPGRALGRELEAVPVSSEVRGRSLGEGAAGSERERLSRESEDFREQP